MKKSILSVVMLTMFLLLSCDFDAISELIDKASTKSKLSDENKNIENLQYGQEVQDSNRENEQEIQGNMIASNEGELKVSQVIDVKSIVPFELFDDNSLIYRKTIEDKDIIPTTKEEKEADSEIKNVERALEDTSFSQLFNNASKLKDRAEQIRTDLFSILKKVEEATTDGSLLRSRYYNREKNFQSSFKSRGGGREWLLPHDVKIKLRLNSQLSNQLKVYSYELDNIMNIISEGIQGIKNAEFFFNRANNALRESIIKRLRNENLTWYRRDTGVVQLTRNARHDAETSLSHLQSSAMKIVESTGILNGIESFIEDAKVQIVNKIQ